MTWRRWRVDPVTAAVARALQERDGWLLIFDNAEEPTALAQYLPGGRGQVMITSRNPGWHDLTHWGTSHSHLAADLWALGRYEQARQLAEDTLTRRRVLGEDHPHTLASASELAVDLRALGHDAHASQLEEWIRPRRGDPA